MSDTTPLPTIKPSKQPTVADQVFSTLRQRILTLELPPGAKLSATEVADQMGVSRQPARDAFYRLSKLGFLIIRPQRATTVSLISETAVMRAQFLRIALETETIRRAIERLGKHDYDAMHQLLEEQSVAKDEPDIELFHQLDDQFHREICRRANVEFAWDLIDESKAHMDRVRRLSLSFATDVVLEDHHAILNAMVCGDTAAAIESLRLHLGRVQQQIEQIRQDKRGWFEGDLVQQP